MQRYLQILNQNKKWGEANPMTPPFVSYITFNRLGLTARNLNALLRTTDDFELHIIDSNSGDNTWEFIESLNDSRIKLKTRLPANAGPIYAVNLNLSRRRPDQYFYALDSDVHISKSGWTDRFMRVFEAFPEAGVLGAARVHPYPLYMPPVIRKEKDGVSYLQLQNGMVDVPLDFVPGHFQCLRPELIAAVGYWSEECGYGDAELSVRVNNYTPYKAGFVTDIPIDQIQTVPCSGCEAEPWCSLDKVDTTCFSIRGSRYKNESFAKTFHWKYAEYFNELKQGKRTAYCASIHDPASMGSHTYNMEWARENFDYYIINAN